MERVAVVRVIPDHLDVEEVNGSRQVGLQGNCKIIPNQLLDLARSKSTVFEAGATTVPMKSDTLKVVKVVTDPAPVWRAETVAIPESDPVPASSRSPRRRSVQ